MSLLRLGMYYTTCDVGTKLFAVPLSYAVIVILTPMNIVLPERKYTEVG